MINTHTLLEQLRQSREMSISLNPIVITVSYYTYVDNGYGTKIKSASPLTKDIRCRKVHYEKSIPENVESNTPDTISSVFYLISAHNEVLDDEYTFTIDGRTYKTRDAEAQHRYGGIIGYRARIEDITEDNKP